MHVFASKRAQASAVKGVLVKAQDVKCEMFLSVLRDQRLMGLEDRLNSFLKLVFCHHSSCFVIHYPNYIPQLDQATYYLSIKINKNVKNK